MLTTIPEEALAKNWESISHAGYSEKRPFAYRFGIKGKMERVP